MLSSSWSKKHFIFYKLRVETNRFNECYCTYKHKGISIGKEGIKIFLRWQQFDLGIVRIFRDGNNNNSNKLTNRYYFNNDIRIGTLVALSS